MQTPERLALIGGSILLASTLVFTLKGQASQTIPKVGNSVDSVYQDLTNTQAEHGGISFDEAYQNAQKQGWQTGQWGSAPYYIDNKDALYIGSGDLSGSVVDVLGKDTASELQAVHFMGRTIPPSNGYSLLGSLSKVSQITGTENIDTSNMSSLESMFNGDISLTQMDISHFDTTHASDTNWLFFPTVINHLTLGDRTVFNDGSSYPGAIPGDVWHQGNTTLTAKQLMDGHPHPGTWVR